MSAAAVAVARKADSRVTGILHDPAGALHEAISQVISETDSAVAEARGYKTVEVWRKQLLTRISILVELPHL